MTAVVVRSHGGPDVLGVEPSPLPIVRSGEVLVEIEAAGVAYADVLMRRGIYPESPALPFTPGYDVVGRVVAGPLPAGLRVAALTVTGGYATHVLVRADEAVPVPDGVEPAQAVALVLNYVTAHQMLHRVARVRAGETVLVLGAAGGVGQALLELAAVAGIRAIGTASGSRTSLLQARGALAIDRV
ncbi:MAG: alcohol dehydrogenase catalytic domain-containing protein [Aeromicrobium sp.]